MTTKPTITELEEVLRANDVYSKPMAIDPKSDEARRLYGLVQDYIDPNGKVLLDPEALRALLAAVRTLRWIAGSGERVSGDELRSQAQIAMEKLER